MKMNTKIKKIRINKGLTQLELSHKTGISEKSIRMYEKGQRVPRLPNLEKIAKVLEISVADLMNEQEVQITFKNWLKVYTYVKGTFKGSCDGLYSGQEEVDQVINELLSELKSLKHLPNKRNIDTETIRYIMKNVCSVKGYLNDLKADGKRISPYMVMTDPSFEDLQFIFSEYKKYIKELYSENTDVEIKASKLLDYLKEMPPLSHSDNAEDSDLYKWLLEHYETAQYIFKRARDSKVIKYDPITESWQGVNYLKANKD